MVESGKDGVKSDEEECVRALVSGILRLFELSLGPLEIGEKQRERSEKKRDRDENEERTKKNNLCFPPSSFPSSAF